VPVPNPFVYGEIVPVEAFLDREAERTQLAHDLLSGQKVFLVAPRRYGKSSLIAVVLEEVQAQGARTVSLTVTQYATYRAFLESFAEACLRAADLGAKLRDPVRGLFSLRPQITYEAGAAGEPGLRLSFEPSRSAKDDHRLAREVFGLPAVLADRTAHPWVVALDEFQKITDFDGSLLEDALRAAVQTQRRVGYVFSGSEPSLMAQMLRPRRPFYKAGPLLALGKIPEQVFVSAIVDRFGQSRIRIGESLARDLVERARNVPYDVQRLAHELWDDAVRAEVREIEPVMIETTIARLLGAYRPMLEAAWQRLTLAKRAVLRAIASEGGRSLLAAEIRQRHGLGPKSSVQRAVEALLAEEWIARENDRYVFVDSLYREWVLRETR
jgi:uncharacterized protein